MGPCSKALSILPPNAPSNEVSHLFLGDYFTASSEICLPVRTALWLQMKCCFVAVVEKWPFEKLEIFTKKFCFSPPKFPIFFLIKLANAKKSFLKLISSHFLPFSLPLPSTLGEKEKPERGRIKNENIQNGQKTI